VHNEAIRAVKTSKEDLVEELLVFPKESDNSAFIPLYPESPYLLYSI